MSLVLKNVSIRFKSSSYWKDVAWLSSGTLIAQVIMISTMPFFSRIFKPTDFAVYNLFSIISGLVAVIATLRYEYFIQLPEKDNDALTLVKIVLFLGIISTFVLTISLGFFRKLISQWAGEPNLSPWLIFVPVTGTAMSLAIALQGWTQRRLFYRRSGEAEVIGKFSYVIIIIAGWLFLFGAGGLILGWVGTALGKIIWLSRGIQLFAEMKYSDLKRIAKVYFRLGGSLVISHGLLSFTMAIPSIFISRNYGAETLGQYALSYFVVCFPSTILGGAIGNVYYQRASERWAQGRSIGDIWRSNARKVLIIGLFFYGPAIITIPYLFPIMFGNVWGPAGYYGSILGFSAFFSFISSPMDKTCLIIGAWWYAPLWHSFRTITTSIVVFLAFYLSWNMDVFIMCLVGQQISLYLIDYLFEWHFSNRSPPHLK